LDTVLFYDLRSGEAWRYVYPPHERPWLAGNSLMDRRTFWSIRRFPEIDVGEDALFVWSSQARDLLGLPDPRIHVGITHGGNVSPKQIGGPQGQAYPVEDIRKLLTRWRSPGTLAAVRDSCELSALLPKNRLRLDLLTAFWKG
jgi:hypothetical protein